MPPFRIILAATAVFAAGAVVAQEATNEAVKARQALMKEQGGAMRTLARMAQGAMPFDAAAATAARDTLAETSTRVVALFEPEEDDPASEALPDIWFAFDDFTQKADALGAAAQALDASSLESLQAGLGPVGGACSACHEAYKM